MKKIMFLASAIMLSFASMAQSDSSMNKRQGSPLAMDQTVDMSKVNNGVMMKNGKMVMVKGSKMTPMTADYTCSEGSKITTSGTVIKKDGTFLRLKEGQYMDKNGSLISTMSTTPGKSKSMAPDSTMHK